MESPVQKSPEKEFSQTVERMLGKLVRLQDKLQSVFEVRQLDEWVNPGFRRVIHELDAVHDQYGPALARNPRLVLNVRVIYHYWKTEEEAPYGEYLLETAHSALTEKHSHLRTLVFLSKTMVVLGLLRRNLLVAPDDLFLQRYDSEDWRWVNGVTVDIYPQDRKKCELEYRKLTANVEHLKVSIAQSQKALYSVPEMYAMLLSQEYFDCMGSKSCIPTLKHDGSQAGYLSLKSVGNMVFNYLSKELRFDMKLMNCFPNYKFLFYFHQLGDHYLMRKTYPLILPSIRTHFVLRVSDAYFRGFMVDNPAPRLKWKLLGPDYRQSAVSLADLRFAQPEPKSEARTFEIRALAPFVLDIERCLAQGQPLPEPQRRLLSKVVVHYHGGGFICTASFLHQSYLRRIAIDQHCLVLSVDYPLAPASKYADIVSCAFVSVLYVRALVEKLALLGPDDYELVLMGDSAGGNLAMVVTNWLILNRQPLPSKLLLAYPAVSVSAKYFSPCYIQSMDDPLLNISLVFLTTNCYLDSEDDPENDMMLSPLVAPEEVLRHFPPAFFFICERDTLHDDALRLVLRLAKLKRKVRVFRFKYLPHGVLTLDLVGGMRSSDNFLIKMLEVMKTA